MFWTEDNVLVITVVILILQRGRYSHMMLIWHHLQGNSVTCHRDLHDPELIETKACCCKTQEALQQEYMESIW